VPAIPGELQLVQTNTFIRYTVQRVETTPINQSINQSINQPINQSINQSEIA